MTTDPIQIQAFQSHPGGSWLAVYPFSLEPWKGNDHTVEIAHSTDDICDLISATAATEGWDSYEVTFHAGCHALSTISSDFDLE